MYRSAFLTFLLVKLKMLFNEIGSFEGFCALGAMVQFVFFTSKSQPTILVQIG